MSLGNWPAIEPGAPVPMYQRLPLVPVLPVGPCGPVLPVGPCDPVGPVGPAGPLMFAMLVQAMVSAQLVNISRIGIEI